jgi:hypothetical protein
MASRSFKSKATSYRYKKKIELMEITQRYFKNLLNSNQNNLTINDESNENLVNGNNQTNDQIEEEYIIHSNHINIIESNTNVEEQANICNFEIVVDEIDDSNNYSEIDSKTISCSLLSLFYTGNFSQTQLKLIIEFIQLFTKQKIPKNFNNLVNGLEMELKNNYTKNWYCHHCSKKVELSYHMQRTCFECKNK